MSQLITWELLKNPFNWIVVWLMVAFFVFAMTLLDPLNTET